MTGASAPPSEELVGLERDAEAAEVADVLTDREGAVDVVLSVEPFGDERVVTAR